jgi:SecD/SecF fusion protein
MAVDANILVCERFKEEIKKGKPLHNALDLGFKRALPAIIDSNSCTILTSMVLYSIGTGPVKGFAITLIIGVLISLFTAVTVTRSLLFFLTDSGAGNNQKLYGLNRNWFGEHLESEANTKPLQIVNNARKWFGITIVVIIAGTVCIAMKGLKPGVEFTGGYEAVYERTSDFPSAHDITANLAKNNVRGTNVKFGTTVDKSGKEVQLAYLTVPGSQMADKNETEQTSFLKQAAGLPDSAVPKSTSTVGPVIQKETTQNAIVGVVVSFGLIIVYLGFRFGLALGSFVNGLRFGFSAIIAGAKDIYVILGVAAAFGLFKGWELSSLFITAMLTVIGFSVHDKIVIFDRVRENLRHPLSGETFDNLMNRSVTQSFARSINTAAAVCAMLFILILFGTTTPELSFFCVTMLAGIAWGTYSSIYTAAPVLSLWEKYVEKHRGPQATLLATSLAEIAKSRRVRTTGMPVASPTPQPNEAETPGAPRSYGQVRRRASAVERSQRDLDDE